MSRNDGGGQFSVLAKYYDALNCSADYIEVADYIEEVFEIYRKQKNQKKPELVLDLACGTGNLTVELDKRGYDMTGADLSADMLSAAASKKSAAGKNILWLNQDMRSFELYGTVDAVICCFDSLNYILCEEDIKKCFGLVYNYLNPGGLFIFDVNSKYKFESVYAGNNFALESKRKEVFCSWQNYYDKKNQTCDFYITLFVRQPDGRYKRYDETQREKYHGEEFLKECLVNTGFGDINIFYDFSVSNIRREKHGRVCFAAAK